MSGAFLEEGLIHRTVVDDEGNLKLLIEAFASRLRRQPPIQ